MDQTPIDGERDGDRLRGKLDRRSFNTSGDEVILVDENDVAIGTMPKLNAHRRGLRHRAISVIVRDRQDRLLLHERAPGKYHSGGLWTNTCCSHPRPHETPLEAATRRLKEEMGFSCPLTFLFATSYCAPVSNELIENEIVHVFGGLFDGVPDPDPDEVSTWCWRARSEIARDVDERPEVYTVWFRKFRDEFWADIGRELTPACTPT